MKTYIRLVLLGDNLMNERIIRNIETMCHCEVSVERDSVWVLVNTPEEIMNVSFNLGILNVNLSERLNTLNPYMWELVNVESEYD